MLLNVHWHIIIKEGNIVDFNGLTLLIVKNYQFTVYNRWGQIVYQTTELNKGWNGSYAGLPQDHNVFVWICTYQLEGEELKVEKGTVTLVK